MYIPNIQIGIPLFLFQQVYTYHHYGDFVSGMLEPSILQFTMGNYIYEKDRLLDAFEYKENQLFIEKKDTKYKYLLEHKKEALLSIDISFIISLFLFLNNDLFLNVPFISLMNIASYYKEWKPKVTLYKPFIIAFFWTISTIIIPCVFHDHNYSIIEDYRDYVPCILTLASTSNVIDCKDYEEDKYNNIETFATKYGIKKAFQLSMVCILGSMLCLEKDTTSTYLLLEGQNIGILGWLIYESNKV